MRRADEGSRRHVLPASRVACVLSTTVPGKQAFLSLPSQSLPFSALSSRSPQDYYRIAPSLRKKTYRTKYTPLLPLLNLAPASVPAFLPPVLPHPLSMAVSTPVSIHLVLFHKLMPMPSPSPILLPNMPLLTCLPQNPSPYYLPGSFRQSYHLHTLGVPLFEHFCSEL